MTTKQVKRPHPRVSITFSDPSLTKQSFKNETDINQILARFQKTGALTHVQNHQPEYGYASALDFTTCMNIVTKGQSMFNELPSSIRTKFDNDPAQFLDFVQDPGNAAELVELGLANAPAGDDPNCPSEASDEAPDPPPAED